MSSSSGKVNVLHIDDEEDVLFYSKTLLEEFEPQLNITNVHTPTELFTELDTGKYDLVLSDYRMPELNGIELGEQVKTRYKVAFILYTGQGSEEVAEKAFSVGIDDYLRKENEPAHYQVLAKRIMHAVEMTRTQVEVKKREHQLDALHQHSWQLSLASSEDIVCEITLNILEQVLGLTFASFQLVEDENLRVIGTHGHAPSRRVSPLNEKGVTNRVARTGKCALIPDVRCDPDYYSVSSLSLSELSVPVLNDDETIAVLNVESERLNAFGESDQHLMELLATHVASALNRLEAMEKEKAQRDKYEHRLTVLHEHSSKLSLTSSVEEISKTTINLLEQVLGFAYASFHLKEGENLRVVSSHGASLKVVRPLNGAGVTSRVARTGKPALIPDTRCEPDFIPTSTPTLSELTVPVLNGDEVVAVLNLESKIVNAFNNSDQRLLELLATHVATSLNRLSVTVTANAQREEYEQRLIALHTHSQELNNAQNPTEVSKSTLKIMVEILKYQNTSFHLIEDDVLITASVTGQSLKRLQLPLNGKGITVRVARTGQTALIGDTRLDSDYVKGPIEALSELAVPAISQGKVVGVLNTENASLNAFSENDRRLIELLAGHVASALSRIATRDLEQANREQSEKQLIERQRKITSILNTSNRLTEAKQLDKVIDIILDTLKSDFILERAGFWTVENGSLKYVKVNDIIISPGTVIPLSKKTVKTRAVNSLKSQLVKDTHLDPDYISLSNSDSRSELAVPIIVDGEVRAIINIEDKVVGRFTEEDQSIIELLAENVASTYKRIEHENRVEALRKGTQGMIAVNSIDELSKITFQTIQSVLSYDYVTLALLEGDNLVHRYSLGWNSSEIIYLPLNGLGITVKAAVTGKSQLVNDIRLNPDYVYSRQGADIALSELAVPVKTSDNVVAVINVESKTEHAFTENDQTILEILANNISSMLTRLTSQNKEKAIKKRYENSLVTRQLQTAAILNASNRLNEATSLENVAEITLETLSEFEFNFASFSIVETDSIIVKKSIGAKIPSGSSFLLTGKTVLSRAVNTRVTQRIEDVRLDPDYTSLAPDLGFRSELAVPILVEGEVKAVINIEDKTVGWFTAEDQSLVELLAESISTTLKRLKQDKLIQALHQSTLKMNLVSSIQELSKVSFQAIHDILGYDFASLALVEEENLIHRYNSGWNKPEIVTLPLDGQGISVKAAVTGKIQSVNDVRLNPDYVHRDNNESLSELALPIKIGDKVVAVLNIESKTENAFSSSDLSFIEIIIQSITSTLTRLNAQESEKTNREQNESQLIEHQHKITSILNASNKLNEVDSLEKLMDITLNTLKQDFFLDYVGFGIVENNSIINKKVSDTKIPLDASIPLSRKTVTTRAVNSRLTQLVKDVRLDPDYINLSSNNGFCSELAVPILVEGEVKAVINIEDKAMGRFTEEDKSLIELLAESISSALKRLEQNNRIEALHQGSHDMNYVNSIEELSKASFQTIYDILGFDSGSFAVIEGKNLIHRFSFGWNSPDAISMPLDGPGISVRAAVTGEPQMVNDVRLDPSYIYMHQIDDPSLSELAVPVMIGARVAAVINVESKIEDAFTENDRTLLEIIAHNVSTAMELLRNREQELTSKQRQFDTLLENVESHGRGIRQSLRIPLQTLANAAYLMLKRPERSEKYYDVITDNVSYCNEILEKLWVNVKADDLALQRVDLSTLLDLSLVGVSGVERVQVKRSGLGKVSLIADEAKMKRMLHDLLQNAVDAMPGGGVLTVAADVTSSGVMITVQDTGVGISKQSMVELFTPFYTTKPNGAGLGLSMCKQVIEAHGGSIRIESEEGLGSMVEVCLPVSVVDRSNVRSR